MCDGTFFEKKGPFIYDFHNEGGATKFCAISQMFLGRGGDFSDPVDIPIYEQKISLFHYISSSLTIICLLLQLYRRFDRQTFAWKICCK